MLHATTQRHQAHGHRPRTALAPIPEAPESTGTPDWESGPAPAERSDLSQAATSESPRKITADERADRAKRAAVKQKMPAWRSVEEWPAGGEARGRVTLRAHADPQAEGTRAMCRIRDGVLTISTEQQTAAGETTEVVVAKVPLEVLAVGLQRGRTNMLALATVHESEMFDEIYCFCDNAARRNRWIAIFRRMGVAIFDLRD